MTSEPAEQPQKQTNRSLEEKSSARLAAAQLLYQNQLTGEDLTPEQLIEQYEIYLEEYKDRPKEANLPSTPPNFAYLRKLLEGIREHSLTLEPWVDKAILSGWVKSRMSPLMIGILHLAIFELAHHPNIKTSIIISEYVALTARFFGDAEVGFINAALKSTAEELRPGSDE